MSELDEKTEELMLVREAKRELDSELKQAKEMEEQLKREIIQLMTEQGLDAFRNSHCQITKLAANKPSLEDYDALCNYIMETKSFDLLQKRLSSVAVNERWEAGLVVPGVGVFHDIALRVKGV